MENATKALFFVVSVFIAIMLFAFMFYMFRSFSRTAKNTEEKMSESEIDAFNSKFSVYDTEAGETITITHVKRTGETASKTFTYTYSQIFHSGLTNKKDYYKALVDLSQSLNTAVDLVTAINDAIDVNEKNNMGYLYNDGKLEVQNSVEIIIDLKAKYKFKTLKGDEKEYQYLVIEPNKFVKSKYVYGLPTGKSITTSYSDNFKNKEQNVNNFNSIFDKDGTNAVSVYQVLEKFRETKIIPPSSDMAAAEMDRQYTAYKYYFTCDIYKNDITNLIETLKFTIVQDEKF